MLMISDETLQSFIFRELTSSGVTDYSDVIGNDGRWKMAPKISNKNQYLFKKYDEKLLWTFARNSGLAAKASGIFGNPFQHVKSLERIFNSDTTRDVNSSGSIQVAFCKNCLFEAISEYGVGYLKSEWLLKSYCSIHSKRLEILSVNKRHQAVKSILALLQGKKIMNVSDTRKQVDMKNFKDLNFYSDELDSTRVFLSRCAANEFVLWLKRNLSLIQSNPKLRQRYWVSSLGREVFVAPNDLEKIFHELNQYEKDSIDSFISDKLKTTNESFGIWDNSLFHEKVLRAKEYNESLENSALIYELFPYT